MAAIGPTAPLAAWMMAVGLLVLDWMLKLAAVCWLVQLDFSRHPALAMSYTEEYEAKTNKNCVLKI
jgi:hypothetical protein